MKSMRGRVGRAGQGSEVGPKAKKLGWGRHGERVASAPAVGRLEGRAEPRRWGPLPPHPPHPPLPATLKNLLKFPPHKNRHPDSGQGRVGQGQGWG